MTCDEARRLAPEAALELLDGALRAEVLDHVAGCGACRAELDAFAATADLLLTAVPPAEPPPGFESRVLDRLAEEPVGLPRRRSRTWLGPAVAAGIAVVVGLGAGLVLGDDGRRPDVVAARLLGRDGQAVGQVLVSDDPDRMVCVLDRSREGARYEVAVTVAGRESPVGSFAAEGPGRPWATDLPVDGSEVEQVVIRDADGRVRATATLGG